MLSPQYMTEKHPKSTTQESCSVAKSCLTRRSHGLQHATLFFPPLSPGVCSKSCPLSWWCYLTISLRPLLLLPSIFPSIRVFSSEMAHCIRWQSIGTWDCSQRRIIIEEHGHSLIPLSGSETLVSFIPRKPHQAHSHLLTLPLDFAPSRICRVDT